MEETRERGPAGGKERELGQNDMTIYIYIPVNSVARKFVS